MPTLLANSGSRLQIVTNGLKTHMDATSIVPGAWVDISGNNLSGSILGTTKYAPYNGGCLSFDGSASYVQTPNMPLSGSANNPWTMGVWVAPSASAGNIISMSSVAPSGSWNMPPISSSGGKFLAKVWQGNSGAVNQLTSSPYTTGSWYYLTLVWDQINAAQYFYVNGSLVGSQSSVVYGSSGVDNFLYLGQANPGVDNTGSFKGYMGNFHYYNRALSSTEISQNYKALSSRYAVPTPLPTLPTTGLQLYLDATNTSSYPGSGTLWYDLSGNGRNFTWYSTPSFNSSGVNSFNTLNNGSYGPASNSFGITNSSGYTFFLGMYQNALVSTSAFKWYTSTGAPGSSNGRGIFSHCTWSDSNIYFDQGGCCGPDTRTSGALSNPTGTWHIVGYRCDGSSARSIWIDGNNSYQNNSGVAAINLGGTAANIGTSDEYGGSSSTWNAKIANFVVYNRALSDTEMATVWGTLRTTVGI